MKWVSRREHQEIRSYVASLGDNLLKRSEFASWLLEHLERPDWVSLIAEFEKVWAVREQLTKKRVFAGRFWDG